MHGSHDKNHSLIQKIKPVMEVHNS